MILPCKASAGQQAADPSARPVDDVQSAALAGDTNPYDSLPTWKSSDGQRYLVWKAYLAVAPAGRPYRVVTVTDPGSARLFYASPAEWGAESGEPVVPPPPRSVRLPTCGPRYTGYTGGILVTRPACVTLTVAGPGSTTRTVRVPVLVPRCLPLPGHELTVGGPAAARSSPAFSLTSKTLLPRRRERPAAAAQDHGRTRRATS